MFVNEIKPLGDEFKSDNLKEEKINLVNKKQVLKKKLIK